jgi:hypothetical protein
MLEELGSPLLPTLLTYLLPDPTTATCCHNPRRYPPCGSLTVRRLYIIHMGALGTNIRNGDLSPNNSYISKHPRLCCRSCAVLYPQPPTKSRQQSSQTGKTGTVRVLHSPWESLSSSRPPQKKLCITRGHWSSPLATLSPDSRPLRAETLNRGGGARGCGVLEATRIYRVSKSS